MTSCTVRRYGIAGRQRGVGEDLDGVHRCRARRSRARELLHGRLASIRTQTERILDVVAELGLLRTDVPFDELVEAHCVLTSVESYIRFVHLDGQSREQYAAFITRTVRD